jgi:hypothetical protein
MSKRLTLTFPDDIYDVISKRSIKNRRSLSQEVIYLLENFTPITDDLSAMSATPTAHIKSSTTVIG